MLSLGPELIVVCRCLHSCFTYRRRTYQTIGKLCPVYKPMKHHADCGENKETHIIRISSASRSEAFTVLLRVQLHTSQLVSTVCHFGRHTRDRSTPPAPTTQSKPLPASGRFLPVGVFSLPGHPNEASKRSSDPKKEILHSAA